MSELGMTAHGRTLFPITRRCGAPTAAGTPCRRGAPAGHRTCKWHDAARKPQRTWTRTRLMQLASLLEEGLTDAAIARKLGTTVNGVKLARKRYGIKPRTAVLLSATTIARRLGIGCGKTVTRWLESGWLRGRRGQRRGPNRQWYVTEAAVLDFLEDPAHWHRYDPARIVDADIREWVTELRRGVRFLSMTEAAERCFVEPKTVYQWIRRGWLPAVRPGMHGNHLVRESDLDACQAWRLRSRKTVHPDVTRLPYVAGGVAYELVIERDGDRWRGQVWDGDRLVPQRQRAQGARSFHTAVSTCQQRARNDAARVEI